MILLVGTRRTYKSMAVRKSMRTIRAAIGATVINLGPLTCAERLQYERSLRREDTNTTILALARDGVPVKQIVKRIGNSRGLVRQVIRGERTDVFCVWQTSLAAHLPLLDEQWAAGGRNDTESWRRMKGHKPMPAIIKIASNPRLVAFAIPAHPTPRPG